MTLPPNSVDVFRVEKSGEAVPVFRNRVKTRPKIHKTQIYRKFNWRPFPDGPDA